MAAGLVCGFLALPGNLLRGFLEATLGNWALTAFVLGLLTVLLAVLTIITSFEILELVPMLSFLIDWIELIVMGPLGPVLFVWVIVSIGISYGLIPCGAIF